MEKIFKTRGGGRGGNLADRGRKGGEKKEDVPYL